jgi:1-acyl-sn-glycerol-3-phosphate acyltransferase
VSPWLRRWFHWYVRRYVARRFAAVRIAHGGWPPAPVESVEGPLVVFLNHPAWWDPLTAALAALRYFPDRTHFAPMDAAQLEKYAVLKRLGFFGVERGTPHGVRSFLTTGRVILSHADSVLWLTPQGAFTDPRVRPARIEPGLTHLAHSMTCGAVLPLAVEYPFWTEPRPEMLIRFGGPLRPAPGRPTAQWRSALERALERTQDALAADALTQDPARFDTLLHGRRRMAGVYGLWQRCRGLFLRNDPARDAAGKPVR